MAQVFYDRSPPFADIQTKTLPSNAGGSTRLGRGTRSEFPIGKPLPETAIAILGFGTLVPEARLGLGFAGDLLPDDDVFSLDLRCLAPGRWRVEADAADFARCGYCSPPTAP